MDFFLRQQQGGRRNMVNAGTAIPANRWPGAASNIDAVGGGADLRVPVLGKRLMPRKRSTGVDGGPAVDQSTGRPAVLCDADAVTLDGSAAEGRFRALLDVLPAAIYVTDADGRITYYNQAAADLAGREPRLGTDEWCVSWRLYSMDGRPMRHDECPMAVALKENRAVRGAEAILERPDGTRIPFAPYPTPLRDASGKLIGAVNMLVDIRERQEANDARAYLGAIIECSDDAIVSKT